MIPAPSIFWALKKSAEYNYGYCTRLRPKAHRKQSVFQSTEYPEERSAMNNLLDGLIVIF